MNHRKSSLGKSRDFGIPTNGKGSADRTTNQLLFDENLTSVHFPGVTGFKKVGLRLVKVYGKPARPAPPQDSFVENEAEWQAVLSDGTSSTSVTNDIVRE